MNFPSQIFFNNINHGYRAAILTKKNFVAAYIFYDCGYLFLLRKDAQNNAPCNCIKPPYIFRLTTQNLYCFMIVVLTKTFFVYLVTVQIKQRLLISNWTVRTEASFCTSCKYRVYIPKYFGLFEQVDTLHFYIIFISLIILLSL